MQASSVIEYLQRVEENPVATMFRGQLNLEWSLKPSICRYSEPLEKGYDSLRGIEEHLLIEFEKFATPISDLRKLPLVEKLIHCQHYGLPTRLLDWSTNPLKALYFAVDDAEHDEFDGVVYAFSPLGWFEGTKDIALENSVNAFYPEILHERLNAQDGCFSSFPLPESGFSVPELNAENYPKDVELLNEICVPKAAKKDLRLELNMLGINHRTIYPGLDGVAKWVKSNLSGFSI